MTGPLTHEPRDWFAVQCMCGRTYVTQTREEFYRGDLPLCASDCDKVEPLSRVGQRRRDWSSDE